MHAASYSFPLRDPALFSVSFISIAMVRRLILIFTNSRINAYSYATPEIPPRGTVGEQAITGSGARGFVTEGWNLARKGKTTGAKVSPDARGPALALPCPALGLWAGAVERTAPRPEHRPFPSTFRSQVPAPAPAVPPAPAAKEADGLIVDGQEYVDGR